MSTHDAGSPATPMPTPAPTPIPTPRPSRVPLGALLVANAVSQLGSRMTMIAIPWFVLQTTGSAAKAGITGFAEMLPIVIASFFGGTLVDRLGFKRASILSDLLAGLTIAAIPALYDTVGLAFWQFLVLVFLVGLFNTPGITARQSLVPDVAAAAQVPLERANAAYQAIPRFSTLLGPALAALLIALLGTANVLWIDAVSYLGSALLLAVAIRSPRRATAADAGAAARPGGYRAELLEGLRWVRGNRLVQTLITLIVIISLFDAPLFAVVLPVYADRVLGSVGALGTIISAFGGGALAGVLVFGAIGQRLPRRPTLAIAFAAVALPLVPLALEAPLWIIAVCAAVGGFVAAPINPLEMTMVQEEVPPELRGRVFGLVTALGLAVAPLGMLLAGYGIDRLGLGPILSLVALAFLLAAATALFSPALRDIERAERATASSPDLASQTDESCGEQLALGKD